MKAAPSCFETAACSGLLNMREQISIQAHCFLHDTRSHRSGNREPHFLPQQLTLHFGAEPHFGREEFVRAPANAAAADFLDRWPDWPSRVAVLTGPEASGKSHLVAIRAGEGDHTVYEAGDLDWHVLAASLHGGDLILVENCGEGIDEAGLFHLINAVTSAGAHLLLTARKPPADWGLHLPDLISRLRAATPIAISEPSDDLLAAIMAKLFADRQMLVDPAVIRYCILRMERSYAQARDIVGELDLLAFEKKSGVTRAVAAELLGYAMADDQPELPGLAPHGNDPQVDNDGQDTDKSS